MEYPCNIIAVSPRAAGERGKRSPAGRGETKSFQPVYQNCRTESPLSQRCGISGARQFVLRYPALGQAAVEEFALEGRVRFQSGGFEMPAGAAHIAGAAVELAERGVEEGIVPQS